MKRTLQTLLFALLVVSTFSGAAATRSKPKAETKKKLVPATPAEPEQQVQEKAREKEARERQARTESAATLSYIPTIPASQDLGEEDESDPDLPQHLRGRVDKAEYLRLRDEYIGILRGMDPLAPFDVSRRNEALRTMEAQIARRPGTGELIGDPPWIPLGPSPVPNGQTQQFPSVTPVSGRATCVVIDPTNSNKVYLGTAQGGVWRTLDGGATWTPIFDAAQSLAIGALALAPSNPSILYVGTGEPNNSADSFFGVGVYRIDNVDTTADLVGPINPSSTTGSGAGMITTTCFGGRAISKILVDPTNPATIFVSTAAGVAGAAGNALSNLVPPLGLRGVFRSTNATAAAGTVTFQKLIVNTDGSLDSGPATGNTSIFDMVMEPGTPNNILVSTSGTTLGGAIYRSTNALAATPTFTQVLFPGFNGLVMHLAINKVGAVVTAYVASNEPSSVVACSGAGQAGRVRKSVDGGVTWGTPLVAAEGYCGGQCSYDNPISVDPNDANFVYIGGNARGTCSDVVKRSADGGTTFIRDDTGLHADSHAFGMDPLTVPTTVWFVNDGGVWKRQDAVAGTAWLNQNTVGLNTIQFVSLAVHATDPFLTIGGTQDNGTEAMVGSLGNWVSAESGDGGFALIDQSSTDATNVTMYHTFFNQTNNFIGFDRTNLGTCLPPPDADKDSWEFRGGGFANDPTLSCDGTAFTLSNGILAADTVLFYAPMALGPGGAGNPNTLYFGTNKLYRSTDRGDTMAIVSQNPLIAGVAVSAIGISPTDDNVRIVGMRRGEVFATTTGSATLTNTAFPIPTNASASAVNRHVSRAVIDPLNSNTAYVTLAYYTNPATAGQIWRTTNLSSATPTWTSIGNTATGLPNVPVNGFVCDPNDPNHPGISVLYAGTDIGVFSSTDSGATWNPFGNPVLPRVAVFELVLQPSTRVLRAATHGRGAWQIALPACLTPTPTVTPGGPTTFCAGGSVTLTSSSPTGNQWYDGLTLLPGETNPTYVATTSGSYNVTVTAACTSAHSAPVVVTVNPIPPTPTVTPGGPTTFCAGGSVTLTSSSGTGNQWYDGVTLLPGETNPTYVATTSGNYNVVVTLSGCSSAPSASTAVTVNPTPPTPTVTPGGPTTFCAGGSVTLTSSSGSGNQWYDGVTLLVGQTNPTYVATTSGNYNVVVTLSGCSSAPSASTAVTVNPIPPTPTVTPGGPTTFCAGGSVTLTSSSGSGNQWYDGVTLLVGQTNPTYVATTSGNYNVVVTLSGCSSAPSASTSVTVNPLPATPTITPGGPTTFCAGGSVTLTSSSATGNQWYLNGNPIGGATNQAYVASVGGNYTVIVTTGGCSSAPSATTTVTVNPNPDATITAPASVVTGSTGNAASVANAGVGATYVWGITGGTITGGVGTNSITFTAGAIGTLTLNVTVTTSSGCPDSDSANVNVTATGPNFDANGDHMIDPSDIFYLIAYLYTGGPAPAGTAGPVLSGDANGDGVVDPADIFYVVNYLFGGGPVPHVTRPGAPVTTSIGQPMSGSLSLGQAVRRDGHWFVPVILTMDANSVTPQALSLRVRTGQATDAVMHRGAGLEPIFETSRRTDDSISYLLAFGGLAPFTLGTSRSAVIAEIEMSAPRAMQLEIDPALTMLVDADGTHKATVANHGLRVSGTTIGRPEASPRTQPLDQNPNEQN